MPKVFVTSYKVYHEIITLDTTLRDSINFWRKLLRVFMSAILSFFVVFCWFSLNDLMCKICNYFPIYSADIIRRRIRITSYTKDPSCIFCGYIYLVLQIVPRNQPADHLLCEMGPPIYSFWGHTSMCSELHLIT